jgi:hypothetical protein
MSKHPKHKYPHGHAHEQARLNAIKTLGLHEHNTAEDRARALGFDWDEKLYHGTNSDFPAFEKHPRYGAGTYATEDPEIADIYAESERREGNAHPNVLPIVARGRKLTVSDLHPEDPSSGGWFRENMAKATGMPKTRRMEERLPHHGYDRLQINDMSDLSGVQTQHMFPDPTVIRSRFAAFDPHRINENDLHAARGGKVSTEQMRHELREKGRQDFLEPSVEKGVMYHGTRADVKRFKNPKSGNAYYVSPDPQFASNWSARPDFKPYDKRKTGPNVMPVHVQVTNPFDYENPKHVESLIEHLKTNPNIEKVYSDYDHSSLEAFSNSIPFGSYFELEIPEIQKAIKELGHDSFYVNEGTGNMAKNLGIFDPRKIKSAIGNRGTYNTNDSDITKAKGGKVSTEQMRYELLAKGGKVDVRPTVQDPNLQRRIPELENAAKAFQAGEISKKDYDRVVNKHKPVKPYDFIPQPATDEDAKRALMANKQDKWRNHESWPAGHRVGLRLDIPAYEHHGVWVNSIHDETNEKRPTSYGPVSSVKNAEFDPNPHKGIRVATGEQNKAPFARIIGDLHHMNENEAVEHAKQFLNHPEWTQVGYDPRRHGYFYDRKSMKPVSHAEHVIQIGPLVLAKNVKHKEADSYAKGGIISMLRKHGRPVDSDLDAMRKMSNGHRVFIAHEQDEMPREIHSVSEMHGYTPDQIYTIHPQHFIQHKATGGSMDQPSLAQMRLNLAKHANPDLMDSIGVNEALDMSPKMFVNPTPNNSGIPGVGGVRTASGLPIGGADMNPQQPGQQLMPPPPPQQRQQGQQPGGTQAPGAPTGATGGAPAQMGNLLSMTPQGQAMQAMQPQNKAGGGKVDRRPFENSSERIKRQVREGHYPEEQTAMDKYKELAMMRLKLEQAKKNPQKMADGGQPKMFEDTENPKRVLIKGHGHNGVQGIVVPRHMMEGKSWIDKKTKKPRRIEGLMSINKARADVYGSENRDPLTVGQIGNVHRRELAEHFAKPLKQQMADEDAALARLRAAKHIGKTANTLDKSEKLDTVKHELGENGKPFIAFASKGVAGHAVYSSGHGDNQKFNVVNTCPGQTVGCGGGTDENGIVNTERGSCFAPNAESQYPAASVRRATHEQAKFDPAMTRDWILAHTGSLRKAAKTADRNNVNLLFRPNVVDETDVSSRHVIKGLNKQRKAENKPMIIANSYGKTNELHDPENGYFVTHSNIGPKVKMGQEIADNIAKDRQRIGSTINAATAGNRDFVNEQGDKTPPKNSYMVTDVKRGSPLSRDMEKNITHAKYWSTGREGREISPEEQAEGEEGHYDAHGKPTTPDKSHYGHMTFEGKRFDYQKQHILHPRLVQVGVNEDGTPHMIPTDSRFKDNEYLPKKRFMTKNGKVAGAILMTTPTESTSTLGHQTSFTHHVNPTHIDYAKRNKGEYEIDSPMQQILAQGREYVAPQPIQILKKKKTKKFAYGGHVSDDDVNDDDLNDDDFYAFPERNFAAQHHLAKREGFEDLPEDYDLHSNEVK